DRLNATGIVPAEVEKIYRVRSCLTSHGQWAPESQQHENDAGPEPALFLATRNGVFLENGQGWAPLYRGLATNRMNDLADDGNQQVFLASDAGLFVLRQDSAGVFISEEVRHAFDHEPDVRRVQQMVINYSDVDKSKIERWHRQSRAKAVLPSVSLGLDRDASELYHWDTGGNPDTLQQGKEIVSWDVSLSWDFSDLVWSSDQTSIDSRSKMMVELREDLMDQVTRLYFERRRLQLEALALETQTGRPDWEIQMRIEELTAMIDAMTGGGFSREIERGLGEKGNRD
ncbi:MAG TPA: hypothetical protein VLJ10_05035, partial [Candidatus Bathyarchaeia archaeon]|nr:hypothetical protein [Candidatus Bathyarchaeia archaeon]